MNIRLVNLKRILIVTAASVALAWSSLNAAAADVTNTITLTYEELGFVNGSPIPTPYPNSTITAAVAVNHLGVDGVGNEMVVAGGDVTFQGSGFGDLIHAAVGPTVTPGDFSLPNPAFGKISIIPTDPNSYLRLISFKIASLDDNNVDETSVNFYINKINASGGLFSYVGNSSEPTVAGDVNNTTHTLHTFGALAGTPVTGAPSQGFEVLWEARNGRLALDDFKFEVVTPSSDRIIVTLPGQFFTSGSGNSGSPNPQVVGVPFNLTLTAVTNNNLNQPVIDISYTGTKTISYSGPGGSPVYTSPVNFTAGQATLVSTTLKKAETTTITATETGVRPGLPSSSLTVNPTAFTKLQVLVPGESAAPGTASGKTGTVANQSVGTAFNVTVNAVDDFFNLLTGAPANNIHVTTSDPADTEPADNTLSSGTRTFSITPATIGTLTVTADTSPPGAITPGTSSSITVVAGGQSYTLTYDGLGVANNAAIPDPYPGIAAATVTHFGRDQANAPYEDVFFWDGVSPGNGYGNLVNVAKGPSGTPASNPAWGGIRIAPNYADNFIRLKSFDIAALDDNNVDETVAIAVYDPANGTTYYYNASVSVSGDFNNSTRTHFDFAGSPVQLPANRVLEFIWTANNGRVAVDNVLFEVGGPLPPSILANNDFYTVAQGGTLAAVAPGVLGNDFLRDNTGPMTASLLVGSTKGNLILTNNGGFSYTSTASAGMDGFTYRAEDQQSHSTNGLALVSVLPSGALFYDDFARPGGLDNIWPWHNQNGGTWNVVGGVMQGTSPLNSAAHIHFTNNWSDYSVEVRASLPANGYGWSVGGRVNELAGKHRYYGVFIGPYGTPAGTWTLDLIKYTDWDVWPGPADGLYYRVNLGTKDTALHALKMTFSGNRIMVDWDGIQKLDVTDNNLGGPSYASGGIALGLYTGTESYALSVEDVIVMQLVPSATNMVVVTPEDTATNLLLQGSVGSGTKTFGIPTGGNPTNGTLSGFNATSGAVTYTPNLDYFGPDAFLFTVSDGTLYATGLVSVTVTPANLPPVVANPIPSPQTATYGTPFNFQFAANTFTDPNGDTLTYTASGMPPGISLNGPNRTFSGSPTATGAFLVEVIANDGGNPNPKATNTFTINVGIATVTPVVSVADKSYDGTNNATISARSLIGVFGSDNVTLTGGTASFSDRNVAADKVVTVVGLSLSGSDLAKYQLSSSSVSTNADITPASLTVSGLTANSKVYDGNTNATVFGTPALSGVLPGEVVSLTSVMYDNSTNGLSWRLDAGTNEVGDEITVTSPVNTLNTFSFEIWGAGSGAGGLPQGAVQVTLRFYRNDGGTFPGVPDAQYPVTKLYESVPFTIPASAWQGTFSNRITLVYARSLGDFDTFATTPLTTPLPTNFTWTVHFTGITGSDTFSLQLYDPPVTGSSFRDYWRRIGPGASDWNLLTFDNPPIVNFGARLEALMTGAFADKNVGNGKTVTISGLGLGGADAQNYTLLPPNTTANITPATVTPAIVANNKVYDGTNTATLSSQTASPIIGGDVVILTNAAATFADKNVGTWAVTATGLGLTGAQAGNYQLSATTAIDTAADITKASVTPAIVANNKLYDGTTNATLSSLTVSPIIGTDVVVLTNAAANFANKNVGTWAVTATGLGLTGAQAGNYQLSTPTAIDTAADITPATLLVTGITANTKVYDGTTVATLNTGGAALVRVPALPARPGDIAFRPLTTNSSSSNVRTYTTAGTYQVGSNCLALAAIVNSDVTLTPTNFSGNGLVWQRVLTTNFNTLAAPATCLTVFAAMSNNVSTLGSGTVEFAVNQSGCNIYICEFTNVWFANGVLGAFVQANARAADSSANPSNVLSALQVHGQNAVIAFFGSASNPLGAAPETGWTEDVDIGYATPSTGLGAYHRLQTTDNNIVLTRAAVAWASAGLELRSLNSGPPLGPLGGDAVTLITAGATGTFATKDVGVGKTVQVAGLTISGADAGNYSLTQPTTTANITNAPLTVIANNTNKLYDGLAFSGGNGVTYASFVPGDNATLLGGALTYSGNSQGAVNPGSYAITPGGLTSSNYTLTFSNGTLTVTSGDLDGDGIPDGYEIANGMNPNSSSDAALDLDGDRFTALQEYQAGTDLSNSASALRISAVAPEGNDMRVSFSSVVGKSYLLQRNDAYPSSAGWTDVATGIPGNGGIASAVDAGANNLPASTRRVYRVSVAGVATEPAGFNKLNLLGNSDTLLSFPVTRPEFAAGLVQSFSGNQVQINGPPDWTPNQLVYAAGSQPNTYYLFIRSGVLEGRHFTITGNGADTVTVDLNGGSLASLAIGDLVSIIPYWTLGTALPSGNGIYPNLNPIPVNNPTEVLLPNFTGIGKNLSASKTFFYWQGAWRATDEGNVNKDDVVLAPNTCVIVRHNVAGGAVCTVPGAVVSSKISIPLAVWASGQQDNFVALPRPMPVSLDDAGLISSGAFQPSPSPLSRTDELLVFDSTLAAKNKSASKTYFYSGGAWHEQSDPSNLGSVQVFTPGTAVIIRKAASAAAPPVWINSPPAN